MGGKKQRGFVHSQRRSGLSGRDDGIVYVIISMRGSARWNRPMYATKNIKVCSSVCNMRCLIPFWQTTRGMILSGAESRIRRDLAGYYNIMEQDKVLHLHTLYTNTVARSIHYHGILHKHIPLYNFLFCIADITSHFHADQKIRTAVVAQ